MSAVLKKVVKLNHSLTHTCRTVNNIKYSYVVLNAVFIQPCLTVDSSRYSYVVMYISKTKKFIEGHQRERQYVSHRFISYHER